MTHLNPSASVVLDYFVRGVVSASTNDPGNIASAVFLLEGISSHKLVSA